MKLVFLNTLDAELAEPLKEFLQKHKDDTAVFCLQECYDNMRGLFAEFSAEFRECAASKLVGSQNELYANVTLVRNTLDITTSSSNTDSVGTGLSLFSTLRYKGIDIHIANIHGLSKPGKLDNPDRLRQSQEIIDTLAPLTGIKIIGGDLNVMPETKSVQLFEKAGYQNLIKDFGIKTTRNEIAWARHPGNELAFSDYVFVKGAEVTSFEVPPEIVSDHQPMILTVNL